MSVFKNMSVLSKTCQCFDGGSLQSNLELLGAPPAWQVWSLTIWITMGRSLHFGHCWHRELKDMS